MVVDQKNRQPVLLTRSRRLPCTRFQLADRHRLVIGGRSGRLVLGLLKWKQQHSGCSLSKTRFHLQHTAEGLHPLPNGKKAELRWLSAGIELNNRGIESAAAVAHLDAKGFF